MATQYLKGRPADSPIPHDLGSAVVSYHRASDLLPSLTDAWYRPGALVHTKGHREELSGSVRHARSGRARAQVPSQGIPRGGA